MIEAQKQSWVFDPVATAPGSVPLSSAGRKPDRKGGCRVRDQRCTLPDGHHYI